MRDGNAGARSARCGCTTGTWERGLLGGNRMNELCACGFLHEHRRIVVTGGPGAGKKAVLEHVRRFICEHVRVLPGAATIVMGGGFPRDEAADAQKASQRAIFHVQRQLERLVGHHDAPTTVLCDRGTLDGLAYWPGKETEMLTELAVDRQAELDRYDAVIHLRTPPEQHESHRGDLLRLEHARAAAAIDLRIVTAWRGHPRRFFVEGAADFGDTVRAAVHLIRQELPLCCLPRDQRSTVAGARRNVGRDRSSES